MPRIAVASARTSALDLATLTPPPLPRPPAWICALTTHTPPPRLAAAFTASSTENAGMPRGVGTPKRRRISLPWYSWIFTACSPARPSGGAAIPLRIILAHRVSRGLERMTAIELKWLALALFDFAPQPREHLDRRGRQVRQQLGKMAAPLDPAHRVVQRLAKAVQDAGADELGIRRFDAVAGSHVGHGVGGYADLADKVVGPDRDPRPHVVHGITGSAHAGKERVVVILDIGEMALELKKA